MTIMQGIRRQQQEEEQQQQQEEKGDEEKESNGTITEDFMAVVKMMQQQQNEKKDPKEAPHGIILTLEPVPVSKYISCSHRKPGGQGSSSYFTSDDYSDPSSKIYTRGAKRQAKGE